MVSSSLVQIIKDEGCICRWAQMEEFQGVTFRHLTVSISEIGGNVFKYYTKMENFTMMCLQVSWNWSQSELAMLSLGENHLLFFSVWTAEASWGDRYGIALGKHIYISTFSCPSPFTCVVFIPEPLHWGWLHFQGSAVGRRIHSLPVLAPRNSCFSGT